MNKKLILIILIISILTPLGCTRAEPDINVKKNLEEDLMARISDLISDEDDEADEKEEFKDNLKDNSSPKEDFKAGLDKSKTSRDKEPEKIDFLSEQDIREYLIGQWFYGLDDFSDMAINMVIHDDLSIHLLFYNKHTGAPEGEFDGRIHLEWFINEPEDFPDTISIELDDETRYTGGDYLFEHMTVYDGKRAMNLYKIDNAYSVFNILGDDIFDSIYSSISFEQETGERSKDGPLINQAFYGMFWGFGDQFDQLWLDPLDDYYIVSNPYPYGLDRWENYIKESALYKYSDDAIMGYCDDSLYKGGIYYIETDARGDILYIDDGADILYHYDNDGDMDYDYDDYDYDDDSSGDIGYLLYNILYSKSLTRSYLDAGMDLLFEGNGNEIFDESFYIIVLGTDHDEHFVREHTVAVNPISEEVYIYDFLSDDWELID